MFCTGRVRLVNDFIAMGFGLLTLQDNECHVLNDAPAKEGGTIGIASITHNRFTFPHSGRVATHGWYFAME
jgi:hypothetical protein